MKLDLSAAFGQLRHRLGDFAAGLEDLEAVEINTNVED